MMMIQIRIKYWLPAVLIGVLIALFSTHYFSSEQTSRVILPVLRWFFPFAGHHALHLMHAAIRKLAHIIEFGIFSIAVFHGVRAERQGWQLSWAVVTLLIALAYAVSDEWHQSFVPLRESRLRDVLIDSTAALLAQALVWVYAKLGRHTTHLHEAQSATN